MRDRTMKGFRTEKKPSHEQERKNKENLQFQDVWLHILKQL
jgi:hypothetical protein